MSALQRVGVTFTDSQKAAVEAMVATGNTAGAQKLILAELQKEFGGSAKAAGETFAGQMDILNNALGNVKEGVGMALMPALSGLAQTLGPVLLSAAQGFATFLTTTVVPAISGVVTWFTSNWPLIQSTAQSVFGAVVAFVGPIVQQIVGWFSGDLAGAVGTVSTLWGQILSTTQSVFGALRDVVTTVLGIVIGSVRDHAMELTVQFMTAWMTVKQIVSGVVEGIRSVISAVLGAVQTFLAAHGAEIQQVLGNAWTQIGRIVNLALEVIRGTVIPILQAIARFIQEHSAEIQLVLEGAWTIIRTIIETVLNTIEGIIKAVLALIKGDWKGAWEEIKKVVDGLINGIKTIIDTVLNTILGIVGTNLDKIKQWFEDRFNDILAFLRGIDLAEIGRNMIEGLVNGVKAKAQALIDAVTGVVSGAIEWARRLLGERSPSRVFRQIGVFAMQGFANGIEESQPITIDAISEHIQAIVAELARLANEVVAPAAVHSAKAFSDAVAPIFENVRDIVEGIVALAGLSGVKLPQDVPGLMVSLALFVENLTARLSEVAARIPGLGAQAGVLAENIGPVFGIVADAVDAFGALNDVEAFRDTYVGFDLTAVEANIYKLAGFARDLARVMGEVAVTVKGELQTAAKGLAENVGPVFGIVAGGVAALAALADWEGYANIRDLKPKMNQLAGFVGQLALSFASMAQIVKGTMSAAAKELAENVGPVVGVVANSITSLVTLAKWEGYDGIMELKPRMNQLASFIGQLSLSFASMAQIVRGEFTEAAKGFAEDMGPIVGVVTGGIGALVALADWKGFDGIMELKPRMNQLAGFIGQLSLSFASMAQIVRGEFTEAAKGFAEDMGPIVGVVTGGVGALVALADWKGFENIMELKPRMNQLASFIGQLSLSFASMAVIVRGEFTEAAKEFATNTKPVTDAVKGGLEALIALAQWKGYPGIMDLKPRMNQLAGFMGQLALSLATTAEFVGAELSAQAATFAANVATALKGVSEAFDLLQRLGSFSEPYAALAWVDRLVISITKAMPPVGQLLADLSALFVASGYEAGYGYVDALSRGIREGTAALAGTLGSGGLTPALAPVGMGMPGGGTVTNYITINNPVVRNDEDIAALADAVSERLGQQADAYRRFWN
jgi:phage-related protein